jgi:hypothetical protein
MAFSGSQITQLWPTAITGHVRSFIAKSAVKLDQFICVQEGITTTQVAIAASLLITRVTSPAGSVASQAILKEGELGC